MSTAARVLGEAAIVGKLRKDQPAEPPLLEIPAAEETPATEATTASGS